MTRLALFVARLVVGAVFIYAGWQKAREPAQFIRDVWSYRLVPEPAAYWIAAFVPYLEIVTGMAVVTGIQRRGAHVLLAAMLTVFVVFITSAWVRGLDVACGCFGAAEQATANYPWLLGRDLLLVAGVAFSVWGGRLAARRGGAWR